MGKLMHDFNCTDAEDMYFELLAEKTRYLKENPKGVNEMCKVMEDLRNESYAEGREEQAKITAFRMGKKGRSPEEIAELIDFDVETVKKWLQTTEE
ncbi:helix-turn-helix domain-containing protein [Gallintestinimicrobium sp.]|uniref:helix-turn-helix domain-containing protein n=1 Tax=Gallintestinimicrobium sp. TaxID=2981655 RepID=UPI003AF7F5E2